MIDIQPINDKISEYILTGNPFSLVRVGNMEGYFIDCFERNRPPLEEFFHWLSLTSGVYPVSEQYLREIWLTDNLTSITNSDILGFVDISGELQANKKFMDSYCRNKASLFSKDEIEVLDPGAILNPSKIKNPWTKNLKGKRVLVISSHKASILSQWENINNVWGENRDEIVPFDLVDVIRAPFHPFMDGRQYENCDTWDKTLNHMKTLMNSYEYDVLLVGAGAYSPSLADHAKSMGKVGITLCGAIQLYFGILGSRWKENAYYSYWDNLYNEHWIYPLEEDLPERKEVFNQFEKAYW